MKRQTSLSERFGLRFIILATIPVFISAVFSVFIYNDALRYIDQEERVITVGRKTIADIRSAAFSLGILIRDNNFYNSRGLVAEAEWAQQSMVAQRNKIIRSLDDYKSYYSLSLPSNRYFVSAKLAGSVLSEKAAIDKLDEAINEYLDKIDSPQLRGVLEDLLDNVTDASDNLLIVLRVASLDNKESFQDGVILFYPILAAVWLLIAIGGATFASLVYRQIVEPVQDMSALAEDIKMAKGNLSKSIHGNEKFDSEEMSKLHATIKDMGLKLSANIEQLEQANKSKLEFISIASHQLRTPLSSIKWLIENLRKSKNLLPEQRDRLVEIYESNERLISLVNDLLNVSRLESGAAIAQPRLASLEESMRGVIILFEPAAKAKGISINLNFDVAPLPLLFDPVLFEEAFESILDNAVAYAPNGTEVSISVGQKGDDYTVAIHNDGPGIDESERKRIFTKFYRGPLAQKIRPRGSGLGLFVAKLATEANGGKIWFESPAEIGGGVTFYLSLPISLKE
ncbi:MAG: HAMP domain-containing sensor histidine kinase [bacterium]|nr:HAMP domain-containing sensor histidine kinase [bacterium]